MAKKWYPVVDILSCIECGTCVNFCSHGVYDKKTVPSPIVINPDGCIDHCHGCGNKCPVGAITYVGDDTGWIPLFFVTKAVCRMLHRVADAGVAVLLNPKRFQIVKDC